MRRAMSDTAKQVTDNLIQSLGQLAESAGFNRMIGQIYALLYLSPVQLSLGEIAEKLNSSKGNVSLNTQSMERWGMIKRFNRPSDRHDYYEADTDFWKVIRGILRNRENKLIGEFKTSVADSLQEIKKCERDEETKFQAARLKHMMGFLNTFNRFFNAYMAMERFSLGSITLAGKDKTGDENED
jgi:DNA-binding transcriptional regulator GbsR (MarR family)